MVEKSTFVFRNSTNIQVLERFAIDVLGWETTFAETAIAPDRSVDELRSDSTGDFKIAGVDMIPDKKFDESYTLLK